MAQSDFVKIVGGVVIGAVAAAGVVALLFGSGDIDTSIYLSPKGSSPCALSYKDPVVHVRKNKKVTWQINNTCTSTVNISVGNFRRDEENSETNCTKQTDGTLPYPFTTDNRSVDVKPGFDRIPLKVQNKDEIVQAYYFDICFGGKKVDPRLIVER